MDDTPEARRGLLLESVTDAIDASIESLADKRALVTLATVMIGVAFVLAGIAQLLPLVL